MLLSPGSSGRQCSAVLRRPANRSFAPKSLGRAARGAQATSSWSVRAGASPFCKGHATLVCSLPILPDELSRPPTKSRLCACLHARARARASLQALGRVRHVRHGPRDDATAADGRQTAVLRLDDFLLHLPKEEQRQWDKRKSPGQNAGRPAFWQGACGQERPHSAHPKVRGPRKHMQKRTQLSDRTAGQTRRAPTRGGPFARATGERMPLGRSLRSSHGRRPNANTPTPPPPNETFRTTFVTVAAAGFMTSGGMSHSTDPRVRSGNTWSQSFCGEPGYRRYERLQLPQATPGKHRRTIDTLPRRFLARTALKYNGPSVSTGAAQTQCWPDLAAASSNNVRV